MSQKAPTNTGSEDDVTADEDTDEDILPPTSAIKWPDNSLSHASKQPRKAKLMPSFTQKSLEFHNCPEAEASPIIKRRTKGIQLFTFSTCLDLTELAT